LNDHDWRVAAATAAELHRLARLDGSRGRHAAARRLLRSALRRDPDPVLRAHILVSLSYYEAERVGLPAGLAMLDEADRVSGLPDRIRGLVASQRGLVYMRAGHVTDALINFGAALKLLSEGEPEDVCRVLLNRGVVHMQQGTLASARADFTLCVATAERDGIEMTEALELLAAKASHNLGYLSLLAGDLPRALREIDAVGHVLDHQSAMFSGVYHTDRAQVLLAAGLFREADDDLRRAAELLQKAGVRQGQAEAELARAQVALVEERWSDAQRLANRARRRFEARGAQSWPLLAAHVAVAADVGRGRRLAAAHEAATALAADLEAAGLTDEARRAALTAATAALGRRDVGAARVVAGNAIRLRPDDPIGTRLQARSVRAGLAEADGNAAGTERELRAALRDLHEYQASFGSLDLQTAAAGHGRRLAEHGLARALAGGGPEAVFGWAERARALSSRLPPVVPPADGEAARLLEELRHGRVELRAQTLAGRVDPALRSRCAELERAIRQRSWYMPGPGQVTAAVPLRSVQDRLGPDGGTLVAHLLSRGQLYALVADGRRRMVRHLGGAADVIELHLRLRADLDVLATNLPEPIRASVRAASQASLAKLDARLWHPLRPLIGDGPLLLAPSADLTTVPWSLLPSTRGRAATVVASATAWLSASKRKRLPSEPAVVVAAGPRVARAAEEVRRVAGVWSPAAGAGDRQFGTAPATAAEIRDAAATADLLHVAAHGVHEPDNPLFSHLELADGPLFGHELDGLPRLPAHVVLSSCELGLARTRPGDETLGMTAALLHGGAGSVVAGVARISDAAACQVGPAHHAGLRNGDSPAAALAHAVASTIDPDADPAPLVCFGAGW
jgi:tetratricopeptide (TPR) repeat protein